MKKPECIIFDFGNVLAFFDHRKASRQLAGLSSVKLSEARIDKIHKAIFKSDVEEEYDTGGITTGKFRERLRSRFEIPGYVPSDDVDAAWNDIFSPNETVIGLIPRLRAMGFKLLLASNTNELHHKFFREQFREVLEYFDGTVTSYETRSWKPDPAFYAACLRKLNRMVKREVFMKLRAEQFKKDRQKWYAKIYADKTQEALCQTIRKIKDKSRKLCVRGRCSEECKRRAE